MKGESFEKGILVSNLKAEMKKRDIEDEFLMLEQVTWATDHKKKIVQDQDFLALNRYSDILPCTIHFPS